MNRGRFQRTRNEDRTRINDLIRVPQIRVIDQDGESAGILPTAEAQKMAADVGLDLVEISPNATPPVCRIMDYGKFKYEKSKKVKEAKKKQHIVHLKEIKLHPKTEEHDYAFKMDHARAFLLKGDRVKATVVFRGREITHIDFGRKVLERFDADIADIASSEQLYRMEGRNMVSIYLPDKAKIREYNRKITQEQKKAQKQAEGSAAGSVAESATGNAAENAENND